MVLNMLSGAEIGAEVSTRVATAALVHMINHLIDLMLCSTVKLPPMSLGGFRREHPIKRRKAHPETPEASGTIAAGVGRPAGRSPADRQPVGEQA